MAPPLSSLPHATAVAAFAWLTLGCEPDYERSLSRFDGTEVPVIVIDTHDATVRDEPRIRATMRLFADGASGLDELARGTPSFEGTIGIEIRGSTSQEFPKKQYGFETWDADEKDVDVSLLGMPEDSDWVLAAPFMDKSLLRNHVAYGLSRALGHYAPRTAFVELFLMSDGSTAPGTEHYRGVYVLTERIKRGKNRVDIDKMAEDASAEPEIAGGYLLEWTQPSRLGDDEPSIETPSGATLAIHYPKADDLTDAQRAWIEAYVADVEAALTGDGDAYEDLIEVDSFVDYFLLNELLRNHDVFTSSTYMHKSRDGKLAMGPVWDFDRAVGDVELEGNWKTDGWLLPFRGWGKRILDNTQFRRVYAARWKELREGPFATSALHADIDEAVALLHDAPDRNFEKWDVLGRYVKANKAPYSDSWEEEIAKMKAWLEARARWIDENIDRL